MSRKDNEYQDIQEGLFEYFKDIDDKTLSAFIDVFVFKLGTQDVKICELNEKFMKDNGLTTAYLNQHHDETHPDQYFLKTTLSQKNILQQVNVGLLTLSYNRFRNSLKR